MDGWNAPQWADFDASVMSDVDEYFNFEHDELESGQSDEPRYHSCPSTPNSKSTGTGKGEELTSYMKTLQINGEKKLFNDNKLSTTPRAFVLKKAYARATRSSTPRVTQDNSKMSANGVEIKDEESLKADIIISKDSEIAPAANEVVENSKFADNKDNENSDDDRTLVAAVENNQISSSQTDSIVSCVVIQEPAMESMEKLEDPTKNEIIDVKPENPGATEIIDDEMKNPVATELIDDKIEESTEHAKKETPVVASSVKNSNDASLPSAKAKRNEKLDGAMVGFSKLETRLNPSRRTILENRKNPQGKPAVLTSHARRRSIPKYRRTSNKFVSLAEAVSKFQNGTPERFRSSNKRDAAKGAPSGPVQKVKQAAYKLTRATSPMLRCKYRARPVAVPNQEEREIMMIEEIRKNVIRPNPIKQSVMNPPKKLKTMTKPPDAISKGERAMIEEPLKKIEKNPTRIPGAPPSTHKTAAEPSKLAKKINQPTTTSGALSSGRKTMMNPMIPPKSLEKLKKSTILPDTLLSSRRTMMNPPKSFEKSNKQATISGASSSSRQTMMNPPKPLTKIDNKSTMIHDPLSSSHKTPVKPGVSLKIPDTKPKSLTESFSSLNSKKTDTSVLSTSIMPESARKHTPCRKTVPAVVSTDEGISIKEVEILHFGIPVGNDYKKNTKTVPFSFDVRNKELQSKREKLKNREIEVEKRGKTFHARPAPSFVAKPSSTVTSTSTSTTKNSSGKPLVVQCPFSFQQRNEIALKKKKEMFDKIIEREKQARIFHAKPAPNFKPVFVRGASAENLRTNNSNDKETKLIAKETRQRGLSQGSMIDNRENTAPNVVPANQQVPKLKNPLTTHNLKVKKTAM